MTRYSLRSKQSRRRRRFTEGDMNGLLVNVTAPSIVFRSGTLSGSARKSLTLSDLAEDRDGMSQSVECRSNFPHFAETNERRRRLLS
jgi:hypothetical protein